MPTLERCRRVRVAEGLQRIPGRAGQRSVALLNHGTLEVKLSAPRGINEQTPHTRDEVYVVMDGEGFLWCDGDRQRFGPGDLLFVPSGAEHRFEDFTDNLTVWVIFYGPEGGERTV